MNLAQAAFAAMLFGLAGQPAAAQTDPVAECDRLAGDAQDPQKTGPGVYINELQSEPALAACRAALAADPGNVRLRYQLGRALAKAEDYESAAKEFEAAAIRGYASAQVALGELYETGRGVAQDQASALAWFRLAAQQGHAGGEWKLALAYTDGLGVEQDLAKATEWFRKAAEHGDPWAAATMGNFYRQGLTVEKDEAAAADWYLKAAELGNDTAQYWLGVFHQEGRGGLDKNLTEAARLIRLAADQGHAGAQVNLGYAYLIGAGVEQDVDKAFEWYRRAAEQGDPGGQYNIGVMYAEGKGVPKDEAEAARWYAMAAEQGNAEAQNNLGLLYRDGRGVPQDSAKARELFEQSAAAGNEFAKSNLEALLQPQPNECDRLAGLPGDPQGTGQGVAAIDAASAPAAIAACEAAVAADPENPRLQYQLGRALEAQENYAGALQAYEAAARHDYPVALVTLGVNHQYGLGVPVDAPKAVEFYRRAIDSGDPTAAMFLGDLYAAGGDGVPQNYAEAAKYYKIAADGNNVGAIWQLGQLYAKGLGVPQDFVEAMRLYRLIAEVRPEAQTEIGWLYQNALGVAQDFAQAAEWYKRASAGGNTNADRLLGILYLHGAGVEKEFGQARAHLVRAAEAGDAEAMRIVGTMDESGQGIASPDYAEAMRWYVKAAEAGNPAGLFNQSKLYQDGLGVPQDHAKAIELLEQAAAKGHLMSMTTLGVYHEQGVGVSKDYSKALQYYERAAAQGDADAAYFAAALYEQGLGVPRDVDKARQFYQQAADAGNETAKQALAVLIQQGAQAVIDEATKQFIADCDRYAADPADRDRPADVPGVASTEIEPDPAISNCQGAVKLSPQLARAHYQLGRAQQAKGELLQAAVAYEAAAGLGSSIAALNVGRMYHKGEGVAPNIEKARTYYEQAAAAGEAGAEEALAVLNAEEPAIVGKQVAGDTPQHFENAGADCDRLAADPNDPTRPADVAGVAIAKINVDEARPPCERAAQLLPDDARRLYQLGRVYYASGAFDEAFSTFNSAAAMGSPGAVLGVGGMYEKGEGVAQDAQQARQHYERAAEAGHAEAMVRLARLYIRGDGVPRDPQKARDLILQAQQAQQQR